jgi:nicotinamide mononucleotide transporter
MHSILDFFLKEFHDLETIGVIFGIISVVLTVKESIWCWPIGIINVLIFAWIFFASAIYGQVLLQFFFLVLILFGWYEWLYGGETKNVLKITRLKLKDLFYIVPINLLLVFLLSNGIRFISEKENLTILDSSITALSFTAQFLLAKKILENWIFWIIVNILSIYLFVDTGLLKISFFYFLLLFLATSGYITWKKKLVN